MIVTRFSIFAASATVTGVRVAGIESNCTFAMWKGCSATASPSIGRPAGTAEKSGVPIRDNSEQTLLSHVKALFMRTDRSG